MSHSMNYSSNANFADALRVATTSFDYLNIFVIGQTGVGKSTLIKEMFSKNIVNGNIETDCGYPITQGPIEYKLNNCNVSIFDTRGFELNKQEIGSSLISFIKGRLKQSDKTVNIAWMCISETSSRVQAPEKLFIADLAALLPVIVVITKSFFSDNEFYETVKKLCCPPAKNVLQIIAQSKRAAADKTIQPMGLETLTKSTVDLLPLAHEMARRNEERRMFEERKKVEMEKRNAANCLLL